MSNHLPTEVPQELAESFAPIAKLSRKEINIPEQKHGFKLNIIKLMLMYLLEI